MHGPESGDDPGPARHASAVIALYRRHAAAFMAARSTRLVERPWIDRFLEIAGPGADILDVGCGSGKPVAATMAARGHCVTGVDSSSDLLAAFGSNVPEAKPVLADMQKMDLGQQFAGVLAWDSLFHLTQDAQRAMLPRLAAHAAPGAALLFNSGPDDGISIGSFAGEPLFHGSLAPGEYLTLLEREGFTRVAHRVEDPDCGGRTVWLFRKSC